MKAAPKPTRAESRMKALLAQPGGISRDDAVARAASGVEAMRDTLSDVLRDQVAALAKFARGGMTRLDDAMLDEIVKRMKTIHNLAGTYDFGAMQRVATSTLDLIYLMQKRGVVYPDAVAVHMQAAQLLSPGRPIPAPDAERLLAGLKTVVSSLAPTASLAGPA